MKIRRSVLLELSVIGFAYFFFLVNLLTHRVHVFYECFLHTKQSLLWCRNGNLGWWEVRIMFFNANELHSIWLVYRTHLQTETNNRKRKRQTILSLNLLPAKFYSWFCCCSTSDYYFEYSIRLGGQSSVHTHLIGGYISSHHSDVVVCTDEHTIVWKWCCEFHIYKNQQLSLSPVLSKRIQTPFSLFNVNKMCEMN